MAEKEFLLGNRARELLKYTKHSTRVVSDDVSQKDVRAIIRRIAELNDIRDVKSVCSEVVGTLDKKNREGFTKSTYRLYGEDMRMIAKGILCDVYAANNVHFATEANVRLRKIDDILDGCSLLLEYIHICVDDKIISVKKSAVWTKYVTDVKYMAAAWRKNDGGRARKIETEAKAAEERRQFDMMKAAVREVVNDRR